MDVLEPLRVLSLIRPVRAVIQDAIQSPTWWFGLVVYKPTARRQKSA